MQTILRVAQREYVETVKTRTFLFGLLMVPVIIGGVIGLGHWMSRTKGGPRPAIQVGVTTSSPQLLKNIEAAVEEHNASHPQTPITVRVVEAGADESTAQERGKEMLRNAQLNTYVLLEGDLRTQAGAVHFYTHKPEPSQMDALWRVEGLVRDAVINRRYETHGIERTTLEEIRNVSVRWVELDAQGQEQEQGEAQRMARMMVPFAFMYLIFIGIVGMGHHMTSSIIEEKNSRIIEVLLSTISPFELMAGKIVGLAGVGLTVMGLWSAAAYMAARWQGFAIDLGGDLITYALIYYVLGFVLFSAILAGVGSICNTIKETQSLMMPITLILIIPLISWPRLMQDPNGQLARVLSYVPPTAPMVMVLRLSSGSDVWFGEVIASMVALAAGVLATLWLAAKVFRTGILMYGKRPRLREVARWLVER